jgi:microcystin-dependent protein
MYGQGPAQFVVSDRIATGFVFSPVSQACDVYRSISASPVGTAAQKQYIHTPVFVFKCNAAGKIMVNKFAVGANKTNLVLTLLNSPPELTNELYHHLRDEGIRYNTDYKDIIRGQLLTPNFLTITIEDVTNRADDLKFRTYSLTPRLGTNNDFKLEMTIDNGLADDLIQKIQNKETEFNFRVKYTTNAALALSSSSANGRIANIKTTQSINDLKGKGSAFSWAGSEETGSVTKSNVTVTRDQKTVFQADLRTEVTLTYNIDQNAGSQEQNFLQGKLDEVINSILAPKDVPFDANFSREIQRLSSYSLDPNDIKADDIDKLVTDVTNEFKSVTSDDFDLTLDVKGKALWGLLGGGADTHLKKSQMADILKKKGWKFDISGNQYIPKTIELNVLSEENLRKVGYVEVKVNTVSNTGMGAEVAVSTADNLLYSELSKEGVLSFYTSFIKNSPPLGTILPFAGGKDSKPNGWEFCHGDLIDTVRFRELFHVLGYKWGKENNGLKFRLPDLRGAFIRGADYGRGMDTGGAREVGDFQPEGVLSHTHATTIATQFWNERANPAIWSSYFVDDGNFHIDGQIPLMRADAGPVRKFPYASDNGQTINENRVKNYAVNFIIRVE